MRNGGRLSGEEHLKMQIENAIKFGPESLRKRAKEEAGKRGWTHLSL